MSAQKSAKDRPTASAANVRTSMTPFDRSWGVVGDLKSRGGCPSSSSTRSVKVPPMSVPTRYRPWCMPLLLARSTYAPSTHGSALSRPVNALAQSAAFHYAKRVTKLIATEVSDGVAWSQAAIERYPGGGVTWTPWHGCGSLMEFQA